MLIYNRWGEVVFETHDSKKGWNGTFGIDGEICQDDTYTWKIKFIENISKKEHNEVGHVNLFR